MHLSEKSLEEIFLLLLKRLPASAVKEFLTAETHRDPALMHRFLIHFIWQSDFSSEEKSQCQFRSILEISGYDFPFFKEAIVQQVARAERLIESRNYLDGYFLIAPFLTQQVEQNPLRETIASVMKDIFSMLTDLIHSEAGYDLKNKAHALLMNQAEQAARYSAGVKECWIDTLIESAAELQEQESLLLLIGDLSGANRNQFGQSIDEAEEELLLRKKLAALEKFGRTHEARQLLEAHKHFRDFCLKLIEEKMHDMQFAAAKELIQEGKKLEERKGNIPGIEWDLRLLEVAKAEGNAQMIRNLARQLFATSDFDFKYYYLLKQQFEPAQWIQQVDRMVAEIHKAPHFSTRGIHVAAKIYLEEKMTDQLLQMLQKNSNLEIIEPYFDSLKEKFPAELLDLYRKSIRRFAEKYMGPDAYRLTADILRKMQQLPGGKEIVQSLAIELKVNYRNRKSFVEELNKVVL